MTRFSGILSLVATVLLAGGLLLLVLDRVPDAGSTPQSSLQPTEGPAPVESSAPDPTALPVDDGDCTDPLVHLTTVDRFSETVESLAIGSTAAFVGTIVSIGPTEWNTPDGSPSDSRLATSVRRMAIVDVVGKGKGVARGSTVTIAFPGGTIGCDTFTMEGFADVKAGDTVVLFVETVPEFDPSKAGHLGMATVGWLVDPSGKVQTPEEGALTQATVQSMIPED